MNRDMKVRELAGGELENVHRLVESVFDEFVAPLFSPQGVAQFKSFIEPSNLEERLREGAFLLVAELDAEVVGVVAMRDWSHIFLLFVDGKHQGKGIARRLVDAALMTCDQAGNLPERVTVNSSPNAVEIYRKMGFVQIAEEEVHNEIRATPMALEIHGPDQKLSG